MYFKRDGQAPENVQTATITIWGKILNFHTHNVCFKLCGCTQSYNILVTTREDVERIKFKSYFTCSAKPRTKSAFIYKHPVRRHSRVSRRSASDGQLPNKYSQMHYNDCIGIETRSLDTGLPCLSEVCMSRMCFNTIVACELPYF